MVEPGAMTRATFLRRTATEVSLRTATIIWAFDVTELTCGSESTHVNLPVLKASSAHADARHNTRAVGVQVAVSGRAEAARQPIVHQSPR